VRISRERIERAFRLARWEEWRSTAGAAVLFVAPFVAVLAALDAWLGVWPTHPLPDQVGSLEGMMLSESEVGATAYVNVRMSDAAIVRIVFPRGLLYRRGAEILLRCISYDGPSPRRLCRFLRYVN
jgi:hypothetical protein